jgi:hypothetical protein
MLPSPSPPVELHQCMSVHRLMDSLFGPKFPCSGAKNSLFRAEQGIGRNALIGRHNKARQAAKWLRIRADFVNFPVSFPVLREISIAASRPGERVGQRTFVLRNS